ncbi:MAG: iron ABC transporter permease, partial [Alphaproteobacteria bacterium]|nr:iron ABC transporter permease [Alphaproteobacteria bacterium]
MGRLQSRPTGVWPIFSAGIALLAAVPVIAIAVLALQGSGDVLGHLAVTVLPVAFRNTVLLLGGTGALVILIGTGAAWLVTAYDFPGRRIVSWALLLPLAFPTYIIAYAYLDLLHPIGPVQSLIRGMLGFDSPQQLRLPDIRSIAGCIVLLAFVLYPYVYVTTRAMFLMQATNFIDVSRTLGVSRHAVFWRVALPLARPAIAVGAGLALMETINDIGASEFLGVRTLTVSIYTTWINSTNLPGAAQIALLMLIIVTALVAVERWARNKQRYTNSALRPARLVPHRLPVLPGLLALLLCSIPIFVGFVAPFSYLVAAATKRIQFGGLPWQYISHVSNTIGFSLMATLITVLAGVIVGYAWRVSPGSVTKFCLRGSTLGYAMPGTVVAIGVLFPLAALDQVIDGVSKDLFGVAPGLLLIGSGAAVLYAYAVRFLAISAGNVEAGLTRIPPSLDSASRTLGETAGGTLRKIHLPLLKPALAAAGLLLFVDCVKELPATLLLRPLNFETLATALYAEAARGTYEEGSLYALSIVLIGTLPIVVLSR